MSTESELTDLFGQAGPALTTIDLERVLRRGSLRRRAQKVALGARPPSPSRASGSRASPASAAWFPQWCGGPLARVFGSSPASPSMTLSQHGVVLWHSNGPAPALAALVDLAPGASLTYQAWFEPVRCTGEDDARAVSAVICRTCRPVPMRSRPPSISPGRIPTVRSCPPTL